MRYYITDNNMKSTTGSRDVGYFKNNDERDQWVETNLITEFDTIEDALNSNKKTSMQILNIINTVISVKYTKDLFKKNYIIIHEPNVSDDYLFYKINEKDFDHGDGGNANVVNLTLELDVLMTYPTWVDNLKDFELKQGHSDFKNYFDYEFDGGKRSTISTEELKRDQEEIDGESQDFTLIAYREIDNDEDRATVNGTKMPYEIYFVPINNKWCKRDNSSSPMYRTSVEMFTSIFTSTDGGEFPELDDYRLNDGRNFNIGILPYSLLHRTDETDSGRRLYGQHGLGNYVDILNVAWLHNDEGEEDLTGYTSVVLKLTDYKYDEDERAANTYTLPNEVNMHDFGLLKGLEDYKLSIRGVGDIEWNYGAIKDVTEQKLYIGSGLVPSDNKTFWRWNDETESNLTSDNSFENNTELATFTDALNAKKAADPIGFKLEKLKPLQGLTNPLTYLAGPKGITAAVTGTVAGVAGVGLSNLALQKQPDKVEFQSNTYLVWQTVKNAYKLVKEEYQYTTNARQAIFNTLYRYGLTYTDKLFVKNYAEIQRTSFNYMAIDNLTSYNLSNQFDDDIVSKFAEVLSEGVRVWNSGFLVYDPTFIGNGDRINDEV